MQPVQFFAFALFFAWFIGSGKMAALWEALKNPPPPSQSGVPIPNPLGPQGPLPTDSSGNPLGGGAGQGVGSATNPAQPQLPGPLMPHG